ncbi:MAG: hypothetical protein QMD13_05700 [Candidatus Bathyarchaeia archaeon]|nr:hypothetical protein [Candidatus Bathyarchaeia archaeon]
MKGYIHIVFNTLHLRFLRQENACYVAHETGYNGENLDLEHVVKIARAELNAFRNYF